MMLKQDPDEAPHGAQNGMVQHHRHGLPIIPIDIARAQPAGQNHVKLDGAALPGTAACIFQRKFELRTVKGALTWLNCWLQPAGPGGREKTAFGQVPVLV